MKPEKNILENSVKLIAGGVGAKLMVNIGRRMFKPHMGDDGMPDGKFGLDKLVPALPVAAGILLSGTKGMVMVSYGLIAEGGQQLLGSFIPALNGIEDMDLSGIFGPLDGPLNANINDMSGPLNGRNDQMGDHEDMGDNMSGADYEHY